MAEIMQITIQYGDQIRAYIKYIGEDKNIKFLPTLCKNYNIIAAAYMNIRELKQATFLSTRTSAGSKPRRYRWRMMASAVLV